MKARGDLGHALSKQGKHAEPIEVFEACLADLETLTDPQPWQLDSIGAGLASAYVAEGRTEPLKTRLLPLYERMVGCRCPGSRSSRRAAQPRRRSSRSSAPAISSRWPWKRAARK